MRDRRNTASSLSSTVCSSPSPDFLPEKRDSLSLSTALSLPSTAFTLGTDRKRRWRLNSVLATLSLTLCGILLLSQSSFLSCQPIPLALPRPSLHESGDLLSGESLSEDPTALIVHDRSGSRKWTVAIPHGASFPLSSTQYHDICAQGDAVHKIFESSARGFSPLRRNDNFMDIADAELAGVLPAPTQPVPASTTCASTLTLVLDADDHNFGKSLLLLWVSYGLARKEGRAFFLDDSRWAYGRYKKYFEPIPSPNCTPPPAHYRLPCPYTARHLVVSTATVQWTFGPQFFSKYFHHHRRGVKRHRPIYDLVRKGYDDLFRLANEDYNTALTRVREIRTNARLHAGSVVGIHIRRGNLHPFEHQFHHDYLTVERYASAGKSLLNRLRKNGGHDRNTATLSDLKEPSLLLASDDPTLIDSEDLVTNVEPYHVERAQNLILLATKKALDHVTISTRSNPRKRSAHSKHVEENAGWDGGFFPALFYEAGRQTNLGNSAESAAVSESAMHVREMIGRAYVLDLMVLGQSSDGIVCAVSSATCRALGIMLGWDAIIENRWVNVDDGRAWSLTGNPTPSFVA